MTELFSLQDSLLHTSESASCMHFVAAKAMSQGSVKPGKKSCHY